MAEYTFGGYHFERTVWANIQLAKMCPGNDINKFDEVLNEPDTAKQFNYFMDIVSIMNQAHERKAKRLNPEHEEKLISREELLDMDEDTLTNLVLTALGQFKEDGKVTVVAEPKKEEVEETEFTSMKAGSSSLAIN